MTGEYEDQNSSPTDLERQHLANQFSGFKSLHRHQSHLLNSITYQSNSPKKTVAGPSPTFNPSILSFSPTLATEFDLILEIG
jgi:hypothetical protein